MLAIDRFAWDNRWQQRHPGEKALLAGGMLLLALSLPVTTTSPLILIIMGVITVRAAGIPLRAWLQVMAVPCGFLLVSVPFLALSIDFSAGFAISLSPQGLTTAVEVVLRAVAAVACLTLLTMTTPAMDLVALLQRLRVPASLIEIMLLIYRLLFIVAERAMAGHQAQTARHGYSSLRNSVRSAGLLAANLLQRSLERAERLEIGLAARGFQGELRVLTPYRPVSKKRLLFILGLLLMVASMSLLLQRFIP